MMPVPEPPLLIGPAFIEPSPPEEPGRGRTASASAGWSTALPADLLAQVRGRIRLIAVLLLVGFAFDPTLYLIQWIALHVQHRPADPEFVTQGYFQLANLGGAAASALLWWIARDPRVSPSHLLNLGLGYEVLVCFIIALTTNLEFYLSHRIVPNMDWVPSSGPSQISFEVVYIVQDSDYNRDMDIQQRMNLAIYRRFEADGIEFAAPSRAILMRDTASAKISSSPLPATGL